MAVVFKWKLIIAVAPDGAGQQNVPSAQSLELNNDFPGANGGFVVAVNNPTQGQINAAMVTVAANQLAAINAAVLAKIQAWSTGSG